MADRVEITTGARLHFGLLSNSPHAGRQFGGAGLMIDRPAFRVTFRRANRDDAAGPQEIVSRIAGFVRAYRAGCPPQLLPPPCLCEIAESLPSHQGLGSGTQLGMAVARGLAALAGEQPSAIELARRVGRGLRSALGVHGFAAGGFLIDGGKRDADSLGVLLGRWDFPEDWPWLLIAPRDCEPVCGPVEQQRFAQLEPMSPAVTDRLCALLLTGMLPAVVERDFAVFSRTLYEFGSTVGDYFRPVQGDVCVQPDVVAWLRDRGIEGVGQTSWGPTVFALCPDAAVAAQVADDLRAAFPERTVQAARALNRGATVNSA